MEKFKREARYIVVKLSDLEHTELTEEQISAFNFVCDQVAITRVRKFKKPLQCVVVESDWPEYEPTWDSIKERMTGESRDFVLMPSRLTAENGAKTVLSGEFHEKQRIDCSECFGQGCVDCDDKGYEIIEVPVSWTTIKEIYKKAVECCQVR